MSIKQESQMDSALAQNIKVIAKLFSETHLRENFLNSIVQKVQAWTDCQCVGIRVIENFGFTKTGCLSRIISVDAFESSLVLPIPWMSQF
jgi:hypothetical protein